MQTLIHASGLYKEYQGKIALNDVDLEVKCGEILGVLGHNGSGKSTLLRSILGLQSAQGKMKVLGQDPCRKRAEMMRHIAYIGDVAVLPEWMSVKQLITYMDGIHPGFCRQEALASLGQTEISLRSKIRHLSKGMKVQLHLALVMASDAQLLILDEPTLGLDLMYRDRFYSHLMHWFESLSKAIVIATHDIADIEPLLSHVLMLHHGKVVVNTDMENLYQQYQLVEVQGHLRHQAEALGPIYIQSCMGKSRMLFHHRQPEQLAELGTLLSPKLAEIFIAEQGDHNQ